MWGTWDYGTDQADWQWQYPGSSPDPGLNFIAASHEPTPVPTEQEGEGLDWKLFWAALADTGAALNNRNGGLTALVMNNRVKRKRLEEEAKWRKRQQDRLDKEAQEKANTAANIQKINQAYSSGGPMPNLTPGLAAIAAQAQSAPATQTNVLPGEEVPSLPVGQVPVPPTPVPNEVLDMGVDGFLNANQAVDEYRPGASAPSLEQVAGAQMTENEIKARRADHTAQLFANSGNLQWAKHYRDIAKSFRKDPNAPLTQVEIHNNLMEAQNDAFAETLGKETAKNITGEARDTAQSAAVSLDVSNDLLRALDAGMFTGPLATWQTQAAAIAEKLGLADFGGRVQNTQEYQAIVGKQVAEQIKAFGAGTGLSNEDRKFAERIVGGDINVDEKTLRKLAVTHRKYALKAVKQYNDSIQDVRTRFPGRSLVDWDISIPELYNTPTAPEPEPAPAVAPAGESTPQRIKWSDM